MPRLPPVIAILDDEENMRIALRRLLAPRGFDIVLFANGTSLIDAVGDKCISAIILDLHMPVMNGFDILESMSKIPNPPPIIVITGHDQIGNAELVNQLGAHAYLTKPIDQAPLLEILGNLFGNPPMTYSN
ncbi:response regulator [Luteolibacter pohnpeiensis]|uniref:Response regulator n=1 Tax=Luteolibacter pohnpeiensis TaxID=454153 RepID=A0A934S0C9_9BACT|nr:response regulator [Luteolibacter pohnpeiensis]MBK1880930.1 response regulator [Luteolibacter pohnpeiensis]